MKYWFECWRKYAVFSGRARRREYWSFFFLGIAVNLLAGILVTGVCGACGMLNHAEKVGAILYWTYLLMAILPGIAVTVRRLHDTGKSALNFFWILFPFVGSLVVLCFLCRDGDKGCNAYGDDPKEVSAAGMSSAKGTMLFFLVVFGLAGIVVGLVRPWNRHPQVDKAEAARIAAVAWQNSVNDVIGKNVGKEEAFAGLKSTFEKLAPLSPEQERFLKGHFYESCGHMKEWTSGCEDFGTNWYCAVTALFDAQGTNCVLRADGARERLIAELGKSVENLRLLSRHVTADLESTFEAFRGYGVENDASAKSVIDNVRNAVMLGVDCRDKQVKVLKSLSKLDANAPDYAERLVELCKEYDDLEAKLKNQFCEAESKARAWGIDVTR